MFEREVEEWADKMYPSDGQAQRYLLTGAKFGYNKAKEECEQENAELKEQVSAQAKGLVLKLADEKALEEENTRLKTEKIPQLERKIASIRGAHSVDCKKLKARTEQVERLKKENAELRKQVSAMSKALVLNAPEADEKVDEVKSKLTEAKEIIRELLLSDTRKDSDWTGYLVDLKERAEAFLKEAENENSNQNS